MPSLESVTALVMIGAGSRYEKKHLSGISHFLEHMAFKGSQQYPTAMKLAETIDGIGGEFNAFTGKDHTGYYIKAHAKHTPLIIDVLSDMLLYPLLNPAEIEKEKGVIIEEIHMYEDTPSRHIGDVYEELIFGNHPLGRDTAGTVKSISLFKRTDFISYIKALYRPNNAVIVVAGNLQNEKKLSQMLTKSFANWPKAITWQWDQFSAKQTKPQLKLIYKDTQQAHLALGVPAYSLLDPRRYGLNALAAILGGGMSSRLFDEIREKRGLAYYVHSSAEQYLDVGSFVTTAGVDVDRIGEAIQVIIDEYQSFADKSKPVTSQELAKAKEYQNGRFTLELEDSRSTAGFYATQEILRRTIKTPQEVMQKTNKVTLSEVQNIASDIFDRQKLNLAIIGPYKEKGKFLRLLR